MKHKGLNQLLCAAVVNERFCEMLIRHPSRALSSGYGGQGFSLTPEERALVIGIRAERLEDLAAGIYDWISGTSHGGTLSAASFVDGSGHMSYTEPVAGFVHVPATI
jgi:hypothetical protein